MMILNIEELNLTWFQSINASANAPELVVNSAKFFAEYVLYALPLFFIFLWFFGTKAQKEIVLKSLLVIFISLCIGQLIIMFFPHPRPFMMGVGRTLIVHAPNASFPSHHMIFFSAVFISHFLAKNYKISLIFFILTLLVAWSRIYLGVHFPFDMIGAFCIVMCVALLLELFWKRIRDAIMNFLMRYKCTQK
jgi:undecaprenyl-diphosphatase